MLNNNGVNLFTYNKSSEHTTIVDHSKDNLTTRLKGGASAAATSANTSGKTEPVEIVVKDVQSSHTGIFNAMKDVLSNSIGFVKGIWDRAGDTNDTDAKGKNNQNLIITGENAVTSLSYEQREKITEDTKNNDNVKQISKSQSSDTDKDKDENVNIEQNSAFRNEILKKRALIRRIIGIEDTEEIVKSDKEEIDSQILEGDSYLLDSYDRGGSYSKIGDNINIKGNFNGKA